MKLLYTLVLILAIIHELVEGKRIQNRIQRRVEEQKGGGSISLMNCYIDKIEVWDHYKSVDLYERSRCICQGSTQEQGDNMLEKCKRQTLFYFQGVDELTRLQFGLRLKYKPYMHNHYFILILDFLHTQMYLQQGYHRSCQIHCQQFVTQGLKEYGRPIPLIRIPPPNKIIT